MKVLLFILMALASVAMADDAKMKKLLTGTWTADCGGKTYIFQSDGKWLMNADDPKPYYWDIQDGQLLEIRPAPAAARSYTILFLTKHEFLALANRGEGRNYIFFKRED
jgi:hypothetical protein